MARTDGTNIPPMDMKREAVVIGITGLDRAKAFYEKPGRRLDADFVGGEEFCVVRREGRK